MQREKTIRNRMPMRHINTRVTTTILFVIAIGTLTAAIAAEPFAWGVNGHSMSQEAYLQVPLNVQLDLVAECGARWYRIDVGASALHDGSARFDELVAEAARRKVHILPVLFGSPGPSHKDASPDEIRKGAFNFAKTIAARYKDRITHWELSNELDGFAMVHKDEQCRSGQVWSGGDPDGASPDHYEESRYQKAKAEIEGLLAGVKAADPNAVAVVDTAGWLHFGFIDRLVKEDHVPFDVLAWHWYSEMGDITRVQDTINVVERLQAYGKPLWITEINRRDGNMHGQDSPQADYIRETAAQFRNQPSVQAYFVYELLDEPYFGEDNGESHYGLVEIARDTQNRWQVKRKKPAFDAYRAAIAAQSRAGGEQ